METFIEKNTGTNTGSRVPWLDWEIIPDDDSCTIEVYMAGGGCSLPGAAKVLMPGQGYEGVNQFVFDVITSYGVNACPPLLVGVGVSTSVETAARLAAGDPKGTLGSLLPKLQKKLNLHPAQVEGFKKLYGYTSDDEAGIRHGMMDKDDLTSDDARYMLVSCSAFANYLLRLAERAGLQPGN